MRKILIIDSDPEMRKLIADFLEARKFEVFQAISGNEGMKMQEKVKPDLVLLSRELLQSDGTIGPDGLRVLKMTKLDKRYSNLPIILMSTEVTAEDFERYRRLRFSADDYVTKPFEDTDLLRRIENLVGFDPEDGVDAVKEAVEEVMEENIGNIFDADKEELGLSTSAATRKELSELMKQVGAEMERHEQALKWEEPPRKDDEVNGLRAELDAVKHRLEEESVRSREAKERWKRAMLIIDGRLKKSQEREERFRDELERMRRRFADIELDHTMELERLQSEKRRMEEEIAGMRKEMHLGESMNSPELVKDLRKAVKMLNKILGQLEKT